MSTTVAPLSTATEPPRPSALRRIMSGGGPIALVAGSVLIALGMGLHVAGGPEDDTLTRAIADHPSQWLASHLLASLGAVLLAIGLAAAVRMTRDRGARLATVGAVLASLGAAFMSLGDMAHGAVGFALAEQVSPRASLDIQKAFFDDPAIAALMGLGMLLPLGILALGVGVLRARLLPRWAGIVLLLSPLAVQAGLWAHGPARYALLVPLVVGLTALGRALASTQPAAREAAPAAA